MNKSRGTRKFTIAAVSVTALLILVAQLGAQPIAQPEREWSVEGDVTSDTGPVATADVSASGSERIQRTTTDAKGHYVIKGQSAGIYLLSASYEEGPAKHKSVHVLRTSHLKTIDFKLEKGAVLNGRVRDDDRNPVQEFMVAAWVKTFRSGRLFLVEKGYAKTNDLGQYRISNLGEGTYYVGVVPPLLKPRKSLIPAANGGSVKQKRLPVPVRVGFYPNAQSFEGAATISLHVGEEQEGVDIVLANADSFCVDATLAPPRGAGPYGEKYLQLYTRIADSFPTAAIGPVQFGEKSEVCGLTRNQYTAVAIAIDPLTKKAAAFWRGDFVIGDRDVDLGTLNLMSGTSLRGKVSVEGPTQETTVPANSHIELLRRGRPLVYGDNLGADILPAGQFLIENVFPDDYGLTIEGLSNGYYVRGAVQQGRDVRSGPVRPDGGELHISLGSDGATIRGQTVNNNSELVSGAAVILIPHGAIDGSTIWSQLSDQDGNFEFASDVAPGEYRLLAFTRLFEGQDQDPEFVRSHLSSATDVAARPKEVASLKLIVQDAH